MDGKHRKTYVTRIKNKKLITCSTTRTPRTVSTEDPVLPQVSGVPETRFSLIVEHTDEKALRVYGKQGGALAADVGESGKGIERLQKLTSRTRTPCGYLCERTPVRHCGGRTETARGTGEALPNSVNSSWVVTLLTGSEARGWKANCVYAVLKNRQRREFVDNLREWGHVLSRNLKTGELTAVGQHLIPGDGGGAPLGPASVARRATRIPLPRRRWSWVQEARRWWNPACALWAGTCASRRRAPPRGRATTIRATTSGSS